MIDLVWLIPAVMGLAALVNGLGCRRLGRTAGYISVAAMAVTFILSLALFVQVRGIAHDAHGDHDHGVEAMDATDRDLALWQSLNDEQRESMRMANLFVRAEDPDNPRPWETTVRGGMGGHVLLWQWIDIPNVFQGEHPLRVEMAFHVDQLTVIFLLFISFVGLLVFIYATGYMKEEHDGHEALDPGYARFFSYLALFAFSMYTLILGANMLVMFIGWEGVGLCSYLLIGYYFDRRFNEKLTCSDAGNKAFIVNRVGDFGLLIGMALLFWGFGTLDFQELFRAIAAGGIPAGFGYNGALITAAALLMFLGATGKSAQIPLFVWLPDAMAGPTPVSALIHAATMVTAGVYMLARMNLVYMMAPVALVVVAVVGAATALVAAYAALTQRGIKKILAYSTVSQLGYMFLAMGVGAFAAGIFHVFTHAFFKACLFLAAGSVIHALHHEEDVCKMGGLKSKMPKTWIAYFVATLAIAGIFPLAGFFSKDEILYMTFVAGQGNRFYMVLWLVGITTAAMTAFYMGRSLVLTFHGKTRMPREEDTQQDHGGKHDDHHHHHVTFEKVRESAPSMTTVLLLLALFSALVGFLNVPKGLIPLGGFNSAFHHFLEPVTDRGAMHVAQQIYGYTGGEAPYGAIIVGEVTKDGSIAFDYHGPELMLAFFSLLIGAAGLFLAFKLYGSGDLRTARQLVRGALKPLYNISWNAWWWDDFYNALFVRGGLMKFKAILWFDQTWVDGAVNGVGAVCRRFSDEFRRLQNGQAQVYGLVMFLGVCLFLLYFAMGLATFMGDGRTMPRLDDVMRPATEQVEPVSAAPPRIDESLDPDTTGRQRETALAAE